MTTRLHMASPHVLPALLLLLLPASPSSAHSLSPPDPHPAAAALTSLTSLTSCQCCDVTRSWACCAGCLTSRWSGAAARARGVLPHAALPAAPSRRSSGDGADVMNDDGDDDGARMLRLWAPGGDLEKRRVPGTLASCQCCLTGTKSSARLEEVLATASCCALCRSDKHLLDLVARLSPGASLSQPPHSSPRLFFPKSPSSLSLSNPLPSLHHRQASQPRSPFRALAPPDESSVESDVEKGMTSQRAQKRMTSIDCMCCVNAGISDCCNNCKMF